MAVNKHENLKGYTGTKSINERLWRNYSEKLRRDKMNAHIQEMAKHVPLVANSPRRLNKASILRLSLSHLKFHLGLKRKMLKKGKKRDIDLIHSVDVEEIIDGFLLVVTENGNIIHTSKLITKHLGYHQVDVIGQSVYNLIHPDDQIQFQMQFKDGGVQDALLKSAQKNFTLRMAKRNKYALDYQVVHVMGQLKTSSQYYKQIKDEKWLVAVVKSLVSTFVQEISMFNETSHMRYISKHDLNGRVLDIDQNCPCNGILRGSCEWFSQLTGFQVEEIVGKSAYIYVHENDMDIVARVHKNMTENNEISETVFRSLTKNKGIYFTQSRTFFMHDRWTGKPKMIVAINDIISNCKGMSMLCKQLPGLIKI